jgi:hypothetical protein
MRATAWTFLAVGATKAGSLLSERKVIAERREASAVAPIGKFERRYKIAAA